MKKRLTNPFDYTSPVDNPTDYVGRTAMRSRLESLILRGGRMFWISVTGPRRMGTTSTLNVALHKCRSQNARSVYRILGTFFTLMKYFGNAKYVLEGTHDYATAGET
jgi:hypothetical protein